MNRFQPSRIAIALLVFTFLACVARVEATDIPGGTIASTLTISDNSQLVGDVTCAVPLTVAGPNPCIEFGTDHIHLRLNGHTITGPVDAPREPNNCSFGSDSKFGVGILVNGRTDVKIEGPGVIQRFQRWGILLVSSDSVTVRKVRVNRNCWSGMKTIISSESNADVALAQDQPRVFRVPFREVNHRILVNVEVDGTPSTLLLDTGARVSVLLNQKGYDCELRLARRTQGKFALACNDGAPSVGFIIPEKEVRFDGFVGADLMSKFASVRIDYSRHLIELEK